MSAIYSSTGQTDTDKQWQRRKHTMRFGSPRRDPFFDPSPPFFEFRPILWELLD